MNKEIKCIDALLFADRDLTEGWGELQAIGYSEIYHYLGNFMDVTSRPKILTIFNAAASLDISEENKFYMLEGVGCDLGYLALKLGYIKKPKVINE